MHVFSGIVTAQLGGKTFVQGPHAAGETVLLLRGVDLGEIEHGSTVAVSIIAPAIVAPVPQPPAGFQGAPVAVELVPAAVPAAELEPNPDVIAQVRAEQAPVSTKRSTRTKKV